MTEPHLGVAAMPGSPASADPPPAEHRLSRGELARLAFVAGLILASWLYPWGSARRADALGLLGTAVGAYPVVREALTSLLSRRMTMELSMAIALAAALAIGEVFTALVIVFFVLIAEALEGMTVSRVRRSIKDLLDLLPGTITVRRDGRVCDIRMDEIQETDRVVVKPGTRIPVDGVVAAGHSFADQSPIIGESMPVEKVIGSNVYAGSINQSGVLDVRAVRLGRETLFGRIVAAIEQAAEHQAPIQKVADRLAGYLVFGSLAAAAVTFLMTRDVRATISVVIVAGACGVAVGTPLAVFAAISRSARQGAIVKGGRYMELLGTIDVVVLDKTGTLTFGTPEVTAVDPCPGISAEEIMAAAATAERSSEHPLARAVLKKAQDMALPAREEPDRFESIPGKGVSCSTGTEQILVGSRAFLEEHGVRVGPDVVSSRGGSAVLVGRGGRLLGAFAVADTLRPDAAAAVAGLRRMGLRTILLTGDAVDIARSIGNALGVDELSAELLPDQKLARVRALIDDGHTVAMVGDGINDAPALTQASVGIAMGSGTDIAQESSDVVLLGNDLLTLVELFRIARRCRRIILANFTGTLLIDGLGIALAAIGRLDPLLAAVIHVSSELGFILNSARLLSPRPTRRLGPA